MKRINWKITPMLNAPYSYSENQIKNQVNKPIDINTSGIFENLPNSLTLDDIEDMIFNEINNYILLNYNFSYEITDSD